MGNNKSSYNNHEYCEPLAVHSATEAKRIFITSDQHLGHKNIIKYCDRPFQTVEEMNEVLIENWNSMVAPNDMVYFLGDLTYGRNQYTDWWLNKLNGRITFFRGNHDASSKIVFVDSGIVVFNDIPFYMAHRPEAVPADWDGWIIHGHHHNNHMDTYPFINYHNKTINVCVELTGYKPVTASMILRLIKTCVRVP